MLYKLTCDNYEDRGFIWLLLYYCGTDIFPLIFRTKLWDRQNTITHTVARGQDTLTTSPTYHWISKVCQQIDGLDIQTIVKYNWKPRNKREKKGKKELSILYQNNNNMNELTILWQSLILVNYFIAD